MILNKIIHVFNDDKFIDTAISLFESSIPGASTYFVITKTNDNSFIYVKSKEAIPVVLNTPHDYTKFIGLIEASKSENLFLHALDRPKQKLLELLSNEMKVVWFVWGVDLYWHWKPLREGIYEKDTKQFVDRNLSVSSKLFNLFFYKFQLFKIFKNSKRTYHSLFYRMIQKVDVVAPILPTEMKFIRALKEDIKFAPFKYVSIEHLLGDRIDEDLSNAKNILIGNSADPSNNHLEIFKKLSNIQLGDKTIYVPLSYGGTKEYIDFIVEKGYHFLGKNFVPITNFMPLKEYNDILFSCGFVIYNHIRQQGVGNIVSLAYLGSKIYINQKSPVYKFFKKEGMHIYKTYTLDEIGLQKGINKQDKIDNKRVILDNYSKENVIESISKLLIIINYKKEN